jgi:hypothetical protein
LSFFSGIEVAFKDRKLEVVAEVLARFKDAAQALGIGYVVTDEVRSPH